MDKPGLMVITTSREAFAQAVRLHQAGDLDGAARLYESGLERRPKSCRRPSSSRDSPPSSRAALAGRRVDRHGRGPAARTWPSTTHPWPRSIAPSGSSKKPSPAVARRIRLGLDDPAARNNLGLALACPRTLRRSGRRIPGSARFATRRRVGAHQPGRRLARAGRQISGARTHEPRRRARPAGSRRPATTWDNSCSRSAVPSERCPIARPPSPCSPKCRRPTTTWGMPIVRWAIYPEARWCYGEAVRLNPEMSHACVSLALTLQLEGRWDDALPWLRRATELQPDVARIPRCSWPKAEVEREHFAEAIELLSRNRRARPRRCDSAQCAGLLLQEEGELELAADHLETALATSAALESPSVTRGQSSRKDRRLRRRRGLFPRGTRR